MLHIVDRPVDKIVSAAGMAAIIEEHTAEYGGAGRLAELMDVAMPAQPWNYLSTMLHLDVLEAHKGEPDPNWDEGAPDGDYPA